MHFSCYAQLSLIASFSFDTSSTRSSSRVVGGRRTRGTGGVFENEDENLLIRESEAGVRVRVQNWSSWL